MFEQGLSHAPDDAAQHLATGCFGIDDAPSAVDANTATEPWDAQILVDPHLNEHRAEGVHRPFRHLAQRRGMGARSPCAFGGEGAHASIKTEALDRDTRGPGTLGRELVEGVMYPQSRGPRPLSSLPWRRGTAAGRRSRSVRRAAGGDGAPATLRPARATCPGCSRPRPCRTAPRTPAAVRPPRDGARRAPPAGPPRCVSSPAAP